VHVTVASPIRSALRTAWTWPGRRYTRPRRLAVAEFRRCDFADATLGPATRLTVSVEAPATTHQLTFAKLSAWLDGGGKSPNEQALKVRLRERWGGA
jgi:hypothetical protein